MNSKYEYIKIGISYQIIKIFYLYKYLPVFNMFILFFKMDFKEVRVVNISKLNSSVYSI